MSNRTTTGKTKRVLNQYLLILAALLSALGLSPVYGRELVLCANPDAAPYSSRNGEGFDLEIASIIASGLGAELTLNWMPDRRSSTSLRHLQAGDCDVMMGVMDGRNGTLNTHAYYRSSYVFVRSVERPEVASLDDPTLRRLRIGVPGSAARPTPPAVGLSRRGLLDNIVNFNATTSLESAMLMSQALKAGEIDVAILWGPMISALDDVVAFQPSALPSEAVNSGAMESNTHALPAEVERDRSEKAEITDKPLIATRLLPEIDMPFMPMVAAFTMGLRPKDEALRDAIDIVLAQQWEKIQTVLNAAGVPLLSLPRPVVSASLGGTEQ